MPSASPTSPSAKSIPAPSSSSRGNGGQSSPPPPLIHLLYNFDIFQHILQDWIEFSDILSIDTALTNHELRNYFFPLLRKIPYRLSTRSKWTIEQSLQWFIQREMYNLLNEIDVNPTSWQNLLNFPQLNRSAFLQGIKQLILRYRNNQHSYPFLSECAQVKKVTLYFIGNALQLPLNIEEMVLYNCTMNQELLQSLDRCERLFSFQCEGTIFLPITTNQPPSTPSPAVPMNHSINYGFFQRIKSLSINGKVFSFLKHWLFTTNSFETIFLDNYFGAQTVENPFPSLFQFSRSLQRLELSRMAWVCFYDLFRAMSDSQIRTLRTLIVNQVGIESIDQALTEEEEESIQSCPITSLTLSRLLYLRSPFQLERILRLTKQQLKTLHIVQTSDFPVNGYDMILSYCPLLEEFKLETSYQISEPNRMYLEQTFQWIRSFSYKRFDQTLL